MIKRLRDGNLVSVVRLASSFCLSAVLLVARNRFFPAIGPEGITTPFKSDHHEQSAVKCGVEERKVKEKDIFSASATIRRKFTLWRYEFRKNVFSLVQFISVQQNAAPRLVWRREGPNTEEETDCDGATIVSEQSHELS